MLSALAVLVGLGALVCFILVLIQMFQHGHTGMGIACIVLVFACGIGGLIAFVFGWTKAREWNLQNIMIAWTVCIVLNLFLFPYSGLSAFRP